MIETRPQKSRERALLIGLEKDGVSKWDLHDSLDELRELANSAGAEVVDTVTQKLQKPTAPVLHRPRQSGIDQGIVSGSTGDLGHF